MIGDQRLSIASGLVLAMSATVFADNLKSLEIQEETGRLTVSLGSQALLTYVFEDSAIPRPYFCDVHARDGSRVTRNHPPIEGVDQVDHATMHPGIWMAFGDLGGEDFWRNQASIQHVRFIESPRSDSQSASFTEEKRYVAADGSHVCTEEFRWQLHLVEHGLLIQWDSTFSSDREFYFGDQEEMGLGVRVVTPVAEKNGGTLRDSEGRRQAHQIWSNAARWCDYSGTVGEEHLGVTIL